MTVMSIDRKWFTLVHEISVNSRRCNPHPAPVPPMAAEIQIIAY
jgi:hypothetical protein